MFGVNQLEGLEERPNPVPLWSDADTHGKRRTRTSFKEAQLRTLKSYFRNNQVPDANGFHELGRNTGLSNVVIKVSPNSSTSLT